MAGHLIFVLFRVSGCAAASVETSHPIWCVNQLYSLSTLRSHHPKHFTIAILLMWLLIGPRERQSRFLLSCRLMTRDQGVIGKQVGPPFRVYYSTNSIIQASCHPKSAFAGGVIYMAPLRPQQKAIVPSSTTPSLQKLASFRKKSVSLSSRAPQLL
jgi:hypothetical protein